MYQTHSALDKLSLHGTRIRTYRIKLQINTTVEASELREVLKFATFEFHHCKLDCPMNTIIGIGTIGFGKAVIETIPPVT
jgi:hypothetical protein